MERSGNNGLCQGLQELHERIRERVGELGVALGPAHAELFARIEALCEAGSAPYRDSGLRTPDLSYLLDELVVRSRGKQPVLKPNAGVSGRCTA